MNKLNKIVPVVVLLAVVGLVGVSFMQMRATPPAEQASQSYEISTADDLEKIERENGKVNIYFFWGNGCPHCAEEFEFFKNIEPGYGDKYNLYTFETWYNDENSELAKVFAEKMGDELRGVLYTVIGEESFVGFATDYPKRFTDAIETQDQKGFDVYLDKIK